MNKVAMEVKLAKPLFLILAFISKGQNAKILPMVFGPNGILLPGKQGIEDKINGPIPYGCVSA